MKLDANVGIAFSTQTHKSFNLARCGDTGGIWQANALHTCLDDGIKDRQQINQVAAKCVLGREAYVTPGSTNTPDQWYSIGKYLIDATTVTKCT